MKHITRENIRRSSLKKKLALATLSLLSLSAIASATVTYMPHGQWTIYTEGFPYTAINHKSAYSNYLNTAVPHSSWVKVDKGTYGAGSAPTNKWSYARSTGGAWNGAVNGGYSASIK